MKRAPVWHVCGTRRSRSPRPTGAGSEDTTPDLRRSQRAGDRDRTGMTSLEGFGHMAADQPRRRSGDMPVCP